MSEPVSSVHRPVESEYIRAYGVVIGGEVYSPAPIGHSSFHVSVTPLTFQCHEAPDPR